MKPSQNLGERNRAKPSETGGLLPRSKALRTARNGSNFQRSPKRIRAHWEEFERILRQPSPSERNERPLVRSLLFRLATDGRGAAPSSPYIAPAVQIHEFHRKYFLYSSYRTIRYQNEVQNGRRTALQRDGARPEPSRQNMSARRRTYVPKACKGRISMCRG